jgi:TRAP-type C4-dicarboxylate transport system permease small subunit
MALFMRAIIVSAGLVAVFIALSVCYEIFVRSVLGRPVIWVEEITAYLVGYITFVGMGAALYEGAHVGIEFLLDRLNRPARRTVRIVADLLMLALAGLLVDMSWTYWSDAWTSGERSTSLLSVPLWIPYLCFLVGSVIFLVVQLFLTAAAITGSRHLQPSAGRSET